MKYTTVALVATALAAVSDGALLSTKVSFKAKDISDGTYNAHLHAQSCSPNDGGAHYLDDIAGTDDAVNGNFPTVTCVNQKCSGMANSAFVPRALDLKAGLSIVVHDSTEKVFCGDLEADGPGMFSGELGYLESSTGFVSKTDGKYGKVSKGKVSLKTLGIQTDVNIKFENAPDASFNAHLHAEPCNPDTTLGGGHYQITPSTDSTEYDAVENWPSPDCDKKGNCYGSDYDHWQPTESELAAGLSIVIHDKNSGNAKMACANLIASGKPGVWTGEFSYFNGYTDGTSQYGMIKSSSATVSKVVTYTKYEFTDIDFADYTLGAHLHAGACNSGSPHYLGTTLPATAISENWPEASCTSSGVCTGEATSDWFIPEEDMASGLSIVIHSPTSSTNARLLCSDIKPKGKSMYIKGSKFDFLDGYSEGEFGFPNKPKKSKVTFFNGMGGAGKGKGMGGMGGMGKKSQLMTTLANNKGTLAFGAGAGLLVVAAAVIAVRRRSAKTQIEMEPLIAPISEAIVV